VTAQLGPQARCAGDDGRCITCSDEAIAMRVVEEAGEDLAVCGDQAGQLHDVMIELVSPVQVGDRVLVHAGVAIRLLTVDPPARNR
jgi:hydrogenase expression/formation protein HypC